MKAKRNTEGLRQNAQAKRQEAFQKVEQGIQKLLKEQARINFNTVAEISGVSKAWLYKEPEVRSRIEHLRNQSKQGNKLPKKISASEASTKALNATLRARLKKLEAENRELRRQNEVAYGQVVRVRELEKQVERLKAENQALKISTTNDSEKEPSDLSKELGSLGVLMNSTLQRLIETTPRGITLSAIETLREALEHQDIKNPGGFLNTAIRDAWKPNEQLEESDELQQFNDWWPRARQQGLVIASEQVDSVLYVCTAEQKWLPFSEAVQLLRLNSIQLK